ncbi:MAG: hypothetical protein M1826_002774 [Phylliscum demangeonii]|nr:MAG: hypothetical protein M1826_002774 [Phylliscum demangeonii]
MDPLAPATSTLSPAIAHIAEMASALAVSTRREAQLRGATANSPSPVADANAAQKPLDGGAGGGANADADAEEDKEGGGERRRMTRETHQQMARWVLAAPRRMRMMIAEGRAKETREEWLRVVRVLDGWKDVDGVEEVRREGERVLREKPS